MNDAKPARVFMAQARPPFAERNGRDSAALDGQRGNVDEMTLPRPSRRWRRQPTQSPSLGRTLDHSSSSAARDTTTTCASSGMTRMGRSKEPPRKNVTVPEGAGHGPKRVASPAKRVQVKMLRTSRESSDSDEEQECERAYIVRTREPKKDASPPKRVNA